MRNVRNAAFLLMVILLIVATRRDVLAWDYPNGSFCAELNVGEGGQDVGVSCLCYEDQTCLNALPGYCQGETGACEDYCQQRFGSSAYSAGVWCSVYSDHAYFHCNCAL
jgi:hypothetical protein